MFVLSGLGHAWNLIDSDEDDEDYVPRKRKKKSAKAGSKSEALPVFILSPSSLFSSQDKGSGGRTKMESEGEE